MLKILYADCLGLSPTLSTQFTFKKCAAAENCKKITQNLFWGSELFNVIDVGTPGKLVSNDCYN